jgi:hypothetical protein
MKIARKRHENPTSYKPGTDATMKASIHSEVRFFANRALWMDGLLGNPRANIYESFAGQANDHTTPST